MKIKPFIFSWKSLKVEGSWNPLSQPKIDFVEARENEFVIEIYEQRKFSIDELFDAIKLFRSKLLKYCNSVEKGIKKIAVKDFSKKMGTGHFNWFVEYQFPPCESFSQIAMRNKKDVKTIKEAIESVGKLIRLPLRSPTKGGRPKGAKDKNFRPQIVRKNIGG